MVGRLTVGLGTNRQKYQRAAALGAAIGQYSKRHAGRGARMISRDRSAMKLADTGGFIQIASGLN